HKSPGQQTQALTPTRRARPILNGVGIARTKFGASRARVKLLLKLVLGNPTLARVPGDCGVDSTLRWPLMISRSTGRPVDSEQLTIFLEHGRFVGYQYGGPTLAARGSGHLRMRATTTRGLALGDSIRAGRIAYGPTFRTSPSQGGTWSVKT